jgi:catechol 2,3-dioxygenase-like lactoylglutathione lyase family enzyme
VKGTLEKAFGYQGNNMQLPVKDVAAAVPFYETVLGFRVLSRSDTPHNSAVLARDDVQIGLVENGGDPTQDGCAFHVTDLASLFAEFNAKGLNKELSEFGTESHGGAAWKVFYVVAPDGLCYWFGERQTG